MARTPTPAANAAAVPAEPQADVAPVADTPPLAPTEPVEIGARHEARVLVAFDGYEPNDIALLTEGELAGMDGVQVDSHPAAVEYAKNLRA